MTESSQTESSETAVYSSDSEEGGPLIRKQNLPAIEGVLVVAQGGGEQTVAADISEAVEALFGLEVHKIKVVEMNQVQEVLSEKSSAEKPDHYHGPGSADRSGGLCQLYADRRL